MSEVEVTAVVMHEEPWWVARCLEVEVAGQGRSHDEAVANLEAALVLHLEEGGLEVSSQIAEAHLISMVVKG